MRFKPIDEMSLRHLFSTDYSNEILKFVYLGPVLNDSGNIETSPDCMVLDKRISPFKPLRCEFKYIPSGKEDFAHNGRFNIAIVWSIASTTSKNRLKDDLFVQNGCSEIIVMEDYKEFRDLPIYNLESLKDLSNIDIVKQLALNRDFHSVYALYIAAAIFPETFQMDKMVELLTKRFPRVKNMLPQGRANAVSAFIQTRPPLIKQLRKNIYRWTNEIDPRSSAAIIKELIIENFLETPPTKDDLEILLR